VFFTKVDLVEVNQIVIEKYSKGNNYIQFIEKEVRNIFNKQYHKKLFRWDFDLKDSLSTNFDYRFCFHVNKGTLKFNLSDITDWRKINIFRRKVYVLL
jgi:hypothetical protein